MYTLGTTVANRYLIEAVVAHGGMGTIYRAQDARLHRIVALKVLRPDLAADRDACVRFLREGQIAAQMIHPNIVRTYDAGEDQAGPFLVQELLPGQTLDQIIPLPPQRAASIMSDVAAALHYIHSRGYIHCDVKPQNILLKQDGTPILVDFGIARAEGAAATTLIATPHYLAPERAMGGPPTIAADLYALGIVLYQTIDGQVPFDAGSIPAIIQQHQDRPVPPLRVVGAQVPVLDRVIAGLTAKNPAQRYPSAENVRADLAAIARDAEHAYPTLAMGATPVAAAPVAAIPTPQPQAARSVQSPPRVAQPRVQPARHTPQVPAALRSTASAGVGLLGMLRSTPAAWVSMPAWRKRRWLAGFVGVLLALGLGFTLVRGEPSEVQSIDAPTQPALIAPQPVRAEGSDTQNVLPTATAPIVEPTTPPIDESVTSPVVEPTAPVQPTMNAIIVESQPIVVEPAPAQPQAEPQPPDTSGNNGNGRGRNDNQGNDKERDNDDDDDDDDD